MTTIIVLPENVYNQYKADGVVFSKLSNVNYMVEVSTVNSLAEIQEAIVNYPFNHTSEILDLQLAESPLTMISKYVALQEADEATYRELYNRLEGRVANAALRQGNANVVRKYTLYPVEENLWVAVQQRLHDVISDPGKLQIKVNSSYFNQVIQSLSMSMPIYEIAKTNLFTNYLDSLQTS